MAWPSRQPGQTDNSIPPEFTDSPPRRQPSDLHRMKETAHIHHGRPLDKSHSRIYVDPGIRKQSRSQRGIPTTQRTTMHMTPEEEWVNPTRTPLDTEARRGSLGQVELEKSQRVSLSGPIGTHRTQSREESGSSTRPSVHNPSDYAHPIPTMDSNPYQPSTHPSSTYNMQAPSQDHTRHVGYRAVMHDPTVSLPVALGSQQVPRHANVAAVMHPFAPITRSQEMPGHALAPNGSMHLPSISTLHYDLNQPGGEPAPPYAVHHQPVYSSNEQQERVELHRQHQYSQRLHEAGYDHAQVYPGHQQQAPGWDQMERVAGNGAATQHNVHNASHQQHHWDTQDSTSVHVVSVYEQKTSAAGPIRHTHQQLQQHRRSHSLASQPYGRPGSLPHTRAASMSAMHPRHVSMSNSDQRPPVMAYGPASSFSTHPDPSDASFVSHLDNQSTQGRQYNLPSRQYAPEEGDAQSPVQHLPALNQLASTSIRTTSYDIKQAQSQHSPLGPTPGFRQFGSPEMPSQVETAGRDTSPVASMHASGAEQETDYSTPASAFQRSGSLLGTPKTQDPSHPLSTEKTGATESSEVPANRYVVEGGHNGRREKRKDPRPHKCLECGKGFPRPSALATHMSVHSGDKPYNCPVVSCNKSFAVRSNARRHLKTHGIKLKARDRPRKGAAKQPAKVTEDEDSDNESEDEPTTEQASVPPPPTRRVSSNAALSRLPPDRGLGPASHRGHANVHTGVHADPTGLNASLTLFGEEHSGVLLERVKRGGKADKRNRWEMEMSGGVKLRTARKDVASERSRRGLRSEEIISNAKRTSDGDDTFQEDQEEEKVHELEEDALLRLCPVREEPSTPQMPQLDRADLDKLIAPPVAWDGFQKQKQLSRNASQDSNPYAGTDAPVDVQNGNSLPETQEDSANNHQDYPTSNGYVSASSVKSGSASKDASFAYTRPGPASLAIGSHEALEEDLGSQMSPFHTSSLRSSAVPLIPAGPATQAPLREEAGAHVGPEFTSRDLSTPPTRQYSHFDSYSSTSPGSASEGTIGNMREDGTWVSASMNGFTNYARLRNSEPFDDLGLSSVHLAIPLPTVQPRHTSSMDGGGRPEERDSYATDIGLYPYHPVHFDRRPILAGPAPHPSNALELSWRSSNPISA